MAKLILDPRSLASLSHDEQTKLLNHQRRMFERKMARKRLERLLIKSKHTDRILYSIAYFGPDKIEFLHMHASNRAEALHQTRSSPICKGCIIGVAPAIGMWLVDEKKGIVEA